MCVKVPLHRQEFLNRRFAKCSSLAKLVGSHNHAAITVPMLRFLKQT